MPPLKLGTTVVKRTRSQMSDVQLHKYTKTALCGSSFLDLRFGRLGIKQLVRRLSKLQIYSLCDIFWKGNDMRTSKTTFSSIKRANTQIHIWSKLHLRPICVRFLKLVHLATLFVYLAFLLLHLGTQLDHLVTLLGDPTEPNGNPMWIYI